MCRIRTYDAYFKSESYRPKYGDRHARVVTITAGDLRLNNLKKTTEEVYRELKEAGADASVLNRYWFTVLADDTDPAQ